MRFVFCNIMVLVLGTALTAFGQEDSGTGTPRIPDVPETLLVVLAFKDINVFEYDLDLVFMAEDSNEIWFESIAPDLKDLELFSVKYDEGFPIYEANEAAAGKKYAIIYVERTVEGEFSGIEEQIKEIVAIEKVPQE